MYIYSCTSCKQQFICICNKPMLKHKSHCHHMRHDNIRLLLIMNCCYCMDPFKCSYTFYSCAREKACSAAAAYNRGCYSAYFCLLWLQPAPSMHQALPYLRQYKCTKSSFKLQFWWASHCTGFTSAIFNSFTNAIRIQEKA